MANFQYTWNDGSVVSVGLPSETGWSCNRGQPSGAMNNFASQIESHSNDSTNLHEVEEYCQAAYSVLSTYYTIAKSIADEWASKENACHNNSGLCWHCIDCPCTCDGTYKYCYKSENELEGYRDNWKNVPSSISGYKQDILTIWQAASDQLALDGQQATTQAFLDQLIATTNQQISLAAYQNEIHEVEASAKKTQSIFLPLMIFLVIVGIMFYMFKK